MKSERVLLVAPNIFSIQLLASNKQIKHIDSVDRVFPAIFEFVPNLIVFITTIWIRTWKKYCAASAPTLIITKSKFAVLKAAPTGK